MKKTGQRGLAMLMVLSIASLLLLFLSLVTQQTIQQMHLSGSKDWQDKAYLAAYTGIQMASATLKEDPYFGTPGYQPTNGLTNGEVQPTSFMYDPNYHFFARICNNSSGTAPLATGWDDFRVPAGKIYVRSDGAYSSQGNDGCISLRALLESSRPLFDQAVLGDTSISLSGTSQMDSFRPNVPGVFNTNFSIATNEDAGQPITLSPQSTCNGEIFAGVGVANPSALIAANGANTTPAKYRTLSSKLKLPSYSVPNGFNRLQMPAAPTGWAMAPNPNTGLASFQNLILPSGVSATIKPGTYFVDDKVEIAGSLAVDLTGVAPPAGTTLTEQEKDARTVFLYVKNSFFLNQGSIVLPAGLSSRNFQVMMIGNVVGGQQTSQFKIEGAPGSPLEATLVASGWGMQARLKNTTLNGAIQGATVNLEDANLHYDETLKGAKLGKIQQNSISGEVFNVQVTTSPELRTKTFLPKLGETFTDVETLKVSDLTTQ